MYIFSLEPFLESLQDVHVNQLLIIGKPKFKTSISPYTSQSRTRRGIYLKYLIEKNSSFEKRKRKFGFELRTGGRMLD